MKISAVISEFNPFHNGHKYLIEQLRADSDNAVAAIMSGSLTQRGDVAITDKFTRAETAVKNGVDLVIELPSVYACSPAEFFAAGGVDVAKALKITEKLCFGAENADIGLLSGIADAFENEGFKAEVQSLMRGGEYYPRAVMKAMSNISPEYGEAMSLPNNILAVEYIRALKGSGITPLAVQRIGAGHDEMTPRDNIASGSFIRKRVLSGGSCEEFIPGGDLSNPADMRNIERALLFQIRNMSPKDFKSLAFVSEGIENRIIDSAKQAASLDELLELIKTKRYTMARIKRILCAAMVGIKTYMPIVSSQYIRVLAFSSKGAEALSEIKKNSSLPLITNVADGYNALSGLAKEIFDIDVRATDLQALAKKAPGPAGADFTRGIIRKSD